MNNSFQISERRWRKQRGSAMVELALCFLGFMMLTFGVMDFAYAIFASNFCSTAAHDAARWASVHGSNFATTTNCSAGQGVSAGCPFSYSDVNSLVAGEAVGLYSSNITVTVFCPNQLTASTTCTNNSPGGEVKVNVTYASSPLSGLGFQGTLTSSGTSQQVISN